jgi:acyl carrier protein
MKSKDIIEKFIREEIVKGKINVTLTANDDLIQSGIIDSLGIQKLIAFLESSFSINIADEELVPENFESIESIDSFIRNKHNNV